MSGRTSPLRSDPRSGNIEIDNLFNATLAIDVAHHEIHEGDAYSLTNTDSVAANNEVVQIYLIAPAVSVPQKRMHLVLNTSGTGAHTVTVTEGITFSSGGAAAVAVNRRRDSAKTSASQTPKIGSDKSANKITYTGGTIIWQQDLGSGKTAGSEGRGTTEWILAPNTEYIFEVASGATSTAIALSATWYEHSDAAR